VWVIAEGGGLWPVYLEVRVLAALAIVWWFVCRFVRRFRTLLYLKVFGDAMR
jgi:hypothetical protein